MLKGTFENDCPNPTPGNSASIGQTQHDRLYLHWN